VGASAYALIGYNGKDHMLPEFAPEDSFAVRVSTYLSELRTGKVEDPFGWVQKLS
jgi:branched-chain amino acid aminotransferase